MFQYPVDDMNEITHGGPDDGHFRLPGLGQPLLAP